MQLLFWLVRVNTYPDLLDSKWVIFNNLTIAAYFILPKINASPEKLRKKMHCFGVKCRGRYGVGRIQILATGSNNASWIVCMQ
jgi:hypothetical protein